jgi:hypothetical protein
MKACPYDKNLQGRFSFIGQAMSRTWMLYGGASLLAQSFENKKSPIKH